MACGVATVMSNVGVNSEIIQHGVNGFLVSDSKEWIDLLSKLIEDVNLREQFGIKGRETVLKYYSVEANKTKYLEVFESVL